MLEALFGMIVLFALFVVVPVVLLAALFKVLVLLVILPFKILGALAHGLFAAVGVLAKLAFGLLLLVFGVVCVGLFAIAIPLLPLLLLGAFVYLLVRAARPAPVLAPRA